MTEKRNRPNGRGDDRSRRQGPYQQRPYSGEPYGRGYEERGYEREPYRQERYDDYYPHESRRNGKRKKRKSRRKIIFAIEVLVLLILAIVLFAAFKLGRLKKQDISKGDILINQEIGAAEAEVLDGYTNIALYGVDSREGKMDIEAHSDALMVASINNKTKDVKLVSVYRDTYLDNTNGEYRKATECYYFGGAERSMNMLNKNLDLNITDFVTIDFSGLADVIEILGGIEIDVQEDEIQWINGYQEEGSQVTGREIVPVTQAGLQTLNGLQAMSYCRIRYTAGSDYKRTERQRTVLEKILQKAKTMDLLKLNALIDEMTPHILTSLSTTEILGLAKDVAKYNLVDTTGFPFEVQTANISAGDCVIPVNLAQNVQRLHNWLFGSEDYTPSATVQEISNAIINETGIQ